MPNYTPSSDEFLVNTTTQGEQWGPQSAQLANGNLIIIWTASPTGTTFGSVQMAQLYDADGVKIGGEFALDGVYGGRIAALPGGGFVTTWWGPSGVTNDNGDVFAQLFDAAGQKGRRHNQGQRGQPRLSAMAVDRSGRGRRFRRDLDRL